MAWGDKRKERIEARANRRADRRASQKEKRESRQAFLGGLAEKAFTTFGQGDEPLTREGAEGGNESSPNVPPSDNNMLLILVAALFLLPKLMKK